MSRLLLQSFCVLLACVPASPIIAMDSSQDMRPGFESLVVFGDSLSDVGNAGRFSNGPVWVEHLAGRLRVQIKPSKSGGTNFSFGGARLHPGSGSNNLRAQADGYLRTPKKDGKTLHIVYGGGNDLLAAAGSPGAAAMLKTAVESLKSIVRDLVRHGATDILVPNLPDVGITPAVRARGSRVIAEARKLTQEFNAGVDAALAEAAGNPAVQFYRLDVYAMAEGVRNEPSAHGFTVIDVPCMSRSSCIGYLFWDDVHPTKQAHERLGEAAFAIITRRPGR